MLAAREIEKRFGQHIALRSSTIEFREGQITAVLGANGAGKSTLLSVLGGIMPPTSGTVALDDRIQISSVISALRNGIAFAHQEPAMVPDWTVADHFPPELRKSKPWHRLSPEIDGSTFAGTLSNYDQQHLEISRALAMARRALLTDEPTAGLGAADKSAVLDSLREASDAGLIVVWVTHDLREALARADRIVVLREGAIVRDGPAKEMNLDSLLTAMGVMNGAPSRDEGEGRTYINRVHRAHRLNFRMGAVQIEIESCEVVGLIGSVSSPARDLFRAAFGLSELQALTVAVDGNTLPRNAQSMYKTKVAYMSRERGTEWLFNRQSLAFNLAVASYDQIGGFFGLTESKLRIFADRLVGEFDVVAPSLDDEIEVLSGGNRQKAVLARLATSAPFFLLLDEPFSGVDRPTRARLFTLLRSLASRGMGIGIYSQESDDLVKATDRVVVMTGKSQLASYVSRETSPEFIERAVVMGESN